MSIPIETLVKAVAESKSIREVLSKLGYSPNGGGTAIAIKTKIQELKLDTSHFTGAGHNKGKGSGGQRGNRYKSPENYFSVDGPKVSSWHLKIKLFDHGIKLKECECCGLSEWLGGPIPLELDHVNGNKRDNRLENLRILCPNCHALTPTYRIKNRKDFN